jgi:hypothetical protein
MLTAQWFPNFAAENNGHGIIQRTCERRNAGIG